MTLDEAKHLKPGDRVLVEAVVGLNTDCHTIDIDGDVWLKKRFVKPEHIREKLAPPRRKFRKGDIVAVKNEAIYYVTDDEQEGLKVYLSATGEDTWGIRLVSSELTLVCAVEDRTDKKGAEV